MTSPPEVIPLSSRATRQESAEAGADPTDHRRPVVASAMTIGSLLDWATRLLDRDGFSTPRLDAEVLLSHVLDRSRTWLLTWSDRTVPDRELQACHAAIQRRLAREPVAYITGTRQFYGLTFKVTQDVLIPRAETELLVDQALRWLEPRGNAPCRILDLCTGSGAIAVALAARLRSCRVVATDISEAALEVARFNAVEHGAEERIEFRHGDLWDAVDPSERFDLILSNPPYVSEDEFRDLQPNVRDYEPRGALVAADDGLDFIARIVARAPSHLLPEGALGVEMGHRHGERAPPPRPRRPRARRLGVRVHGRRTPRTRRRRPRTRRRRPRRSPRLQGPCAPPTREGKKLAGGCHRRQRNPRAGAARASPDDPPRRGAQPRVAAPGA